MPKMSPGLLAVAAPLFAFAMQDGGAETFDIRQPAVVAQLMSEAGMKAEQYENRVGEPFVGSVNGAKSFTVQFYDCTAKRDCRSLQFYTFYRKEAFFTPDIANAWNAQKRFLRTAIDSEGDFIVFMDVSAEGGMTRAHFTDTLAWFTTMEAQFRAFLAEHRAAASTAPAAPAP